MIELSSDTAKKAYSRYSRLDSTGGNDGTNPAANAPQSGFIETAAKMNTTIATPMKPKTRSIHANLKNQTTSRKNGRASTITARYGQPESNCQSSAIPPISAAQVIRQTAFAAISVTSAALKPTRSRITV